MEVARWPRKNTVDLRDTARSFSNPFPCCDDNVSVGRSRVLRGIRIDALLALHHAPLPQVLLAEAWLAFDRGNDLFALARRANPTIVSIALRDGDARALSATQLQCDLNE